MKQYRLIYLSLCLILPVLVSAQSKGKFEFMKVEHDFGAIQEEKGEVEYQFTFKNTGSEPIFITNVKASCGCTTPGWTNDSIMSGEEGFINAKFSTVNRPGSFRKTLTVNSNAENPVELLYIKGKVIPKVISIAESLPFKVGDLRLKSQQFNLFRITTKEPVTKSFKIYNGGGDTISLSDKYVGPEFIKLSLDTTWLLSGQSSRLNIWYDPNHENNLGMNNHSLSFYTSESTDPKSIQVIAQVQEYFPSMTEKESANAPKLLIEDRLQDLGVIKQGGKREAKFLLRNGGKNTLNIRKVDANCNCLKIKLESENIKGGEMTYLTVTFDSKNRRGRQTKSVSIFSNDPNDPTQLVSLKVSVSP